MLTDPLLLNGTDRSRRHRPLAPEQTIASGRDKLESWIFCETHLQIPVGEMTFHVFTLAHNKKYPGWSFSNDRHSYHELVYTVRGSGHYELGGKTYACKQGDLFLCPRNKIYHGAINTCCTSWNSLVIGFDFFFARDPETYLDDLTVFPAILPFHRHFFVDQQAFLEVAYELRVPIELVVERLEIELKNQNFDYDVVLRSQLLELLSLICRAARSQIPHTPLRQYASQAKALLRLERARQYMVENMCENVRLE